MKIRVLIADDSKLFRSALRNLLEMDPEIDVIGEASSGLEACRVALESRPQVVCMDFRMDQKNSIDSTRRLMAAMPEMKIIGLSACFEDSTQAAMLAAGAVTYVVKANAAKELLPAIHALFAPAVQMEDIAL